MVFCLFYLDQTTTVFFGGSVNNQRIVIYNWTTKQYRLNYETVSAHTVVIIIPSCDISIVVSVTRCLDYFSIFDLL